MTRFMGHSLEIVFDEFKLHFQGQNSMSLSDSRLHMNSLEATSHVSLVRLLVV